MDCLGGAEEGLSSSRLEVGNSATCPGEAAHAPVSKWVLLLYLCAGTATAVRSEPLGCECQHVLLSCISAEKLTHSCVFISVGRKIASLFLRPSFESAPDVLNIP